MSSVGETDWMFFMTIDLEHRGGKSVELDQTINLRVGIGIIQPSVEQSTISIMVTITVNGATLP